MIYNAFSKYRLLEADDDDNAAGGNEGGGQTVDASGGDADANNDQGGGDENQNADDNAENPDENGDDQGDDYDIDDSAADEPVEDEGGGDDEAGGDDTGGDSGGLDSGDEEESDEEKIQKDDSKKANPQFDDIYNGLSPKQKAIRDRELRANYMRMYKQVSSVIENLSMLPKTSDTNKQIKRVMETLFSFRRYMAYYVNNLYATKTLIENTVEYYKYLAVFSSYRDIVKELEKQLVH